MSPLQGLKEIFSKVTDIFTPNEKKSSIFLLLLMLVGMFLEMLGVGLVLPVIGIFTQPDSSALHPALQDLLKPFDGFSYNTIIVAAMLFLGGIYLVKNIFLAILLWIQTRFSYKLQANISQRLFTIYLRQPYTFHLQRNSAELIRNVTGEVNSFAVGFITPALLLIAESLVLFGICVLLLIVEPQGTLIVMTLLGLASWGVYFLSKNHLSRWGQARQYHDGMRIQHLQQGLGGAKDVKLLGRESDFLAQYENHTVQVSRVNQFQTILQQLPRLWLELFAIIGLVVLVLVMLKLDRDVKLIVPTLGLFAAAAFRLMPSVNRLLSAAQTLRYNLPVINVLHKELLLDVPEANNQSNNVSCEFLHDIHLNDVSYTYDGSLTAALDNLSLTIQKGKSVGIIGPSGSGKSTLVDLILGLLPPDEGKVVVDGKDIQGNLREWQDQIGYVPQTIYLTDDTLRRNVAFGVPDEQIDTAAVNNAIQASQLHQYVAELPDGIESVVGEHGVRLSGGQRQRIGIARALYHNPAILVLDEATSALDTVTESSVMQTIAELQYDKTILIVAHRLSTIEHCDWIYRLDKGSLISEGTPTRILSKSGMNHTG